MLVLPIVLRLAGDVFAQETIVPLTPIQVSTTTGEKPQSKVWFHDGRWWAVLPSKSVTPTGTWLWRLGIDHRWTNLLRLSASTNAKADVRSVGDVAHVLLHTGSAQLVSLEYRPATQTYVLWPERPTTTSLSLSSSETATIDLDSTGRMWLATDSSSDILVYYSDWPYSRFEGPISLASGTSSDDIAVVTAVHLLGLPSIGVLWSNQNTQLFGFRLHVDGLDPLVWLADEMPAQQSALHVGQGMGDDHMHFVAASDGTLYAAVKTSYNTRSYPQISLLKRHPGGEWDDLYFVDDQGTRGIALLNEAANLLRVIYRDDGGNNIVYRDTLPSTIGFGARRTLIPGPVNDPTSTKDNWTDQVVVLAQGAGALVLRTGVTTTTTTRPATTTTRATTTTTRVTTTTLSTTTTSSTTTTLPPGVSAVQVRVATSSDDAEEALSGQVSLTSSDLELVNDGGLQTVGLRFAGVAVPPGATIVDATVQFQVDEATSEATTVTLQAQASDQAATFTSTAGNVSSRPRTAAAVSWAIGPWPTVGAVSGPQRTPSVAAMIQEVVNRPGWTSGNALALVITGSGHRVGESYDGLPAGAPLLRIQYAAGGSGNTSTSTTATTTTTSSTVTTTTTSSTTTTLPPGVSAVQIRVATSSDDAEEALSGQVSLTSSDLELVNDGGLQTVGLRFAGVAVPPGTTIVDATVQFQVDEATSEATTVTLQAQASDQAATFTSTAGNVSSRPRTAAAVSWAIDPWPTAGAAAGPQRTPSLAAVIQELVNRPGWTSGNALALVITGSGHRVGESYDGLPAGAPLLRIEYAAGATTTTTSSTSTTSTSTTTSSSTTSTSASTTTSTSSTTTSTSSSSTTSTTETSSTTTTTSTTTEPTTTSTTETSTSTVDPTTTTTEAIVTSTTAESTSSTTTTTTVEPSTTTTSTLTPP